ncbi:MAG: hypothetical protein A2Z01_11650 [Betaproteobacteria bacterium RBG_16_58_11]|nr:MAG: hypothetical protein A2Z01_11650 [Betaproteobacteria bacterium RBG_16_58_11]
MSGIGLLRDSFFTASFHQTLDILRTRFRVDLFHDQAVFINIFNFFKGIGMSPGIAFLLTMLGMLQL